MKFLSKDGACLWSDLDEACEAAGGMLGLLSQRLARQLDGIPIHLRRLNPWYSACEPGCPDDPTANARSG
jgi:hypothetical protein